ncbi:hypothetical protein M3I54_44325 [Paraburkholderia sp. CNPSo 3274]|nr:hypothetical protein [Paraburkholderia sp. CNPSo 3274]MCP3721477.1 hypothetical protein [Paraburkholderia sp. CNPSo 3281]
MKHQYVRFGRFALLEAIYKLSVSLQCCARRKQRLIRVPVVDMSTPPACVGLANKRDKHATIRCHLPGMENRLLQWERYLHSLHPAQKSLEG